jgi:chromate reductase, NAD(P)H dehydrogenase (quinone)
MQFDFYLSSSMSCFHLVIERSNMPIPKILVFSGSNRPGSLNAKVARLAAVKLRDAGAKVTEVDLDKYKLPIVDATGFGHAPRNALRFAEALSSHHGMFIASPEYNAGYAPLLKNALDWATVAKPSAPGTGLAGKVIGVASASPGPLGGYRGLIQLRSILELGYGAIVIPEMAAIGGGDAAWNEDGTLKDKRTSDFFDALIARLVKEASLKRS